MKLLLLICVLCVLCRVGSNVIGIDLASDAFKVAIVQPGTPLEIVTNFQSKRKTPTCIAFYKGERLFGSDATALMGRKPEASFAKLTRMLGRTPDHPLVKEVGSQYFPYKIYTNETSGHTNLLVENDEAYTVEELMAMLLQHLKDIVHNFGGKGIKDCVVTVPAGFTQHEKNALYSAAEIADLKVLSLIEENTAAALHYAIDRTFEQPSNVLYYNMGAGSAQVSIVSYSSTQVKEGGKNKSVGQFEVLGKAWDDSLGGFNFDMKLTDLLATRFNEAWNKKASGKGKDVRDFFRPMTRLRLEASKVKEVLSANNEFPIRAEQLHADTDLVTKVTRADFEAACADLFDRVTQPIEAALRMANLSLSDIHNVEILGGGVRMPRIKRLLEDYFKSSNLTLGQHLNGDEAFALGAAFRAANLSTAFRVRKIGMTDVTSLGVSIQLDDLPVEESKGLFGGLFGSKKAEEASEGSEAWTKSTMLYPAKSQMPGKSKTVAFTHDKDISCKLQYSESELLPSGTDPLIALYNITGIATFAKDHSQHIHASSPPNLPKVHLSYTLDSSGSVHLTKAEVTLEVEEDDTASTPAQEKNETVAQEKNETTTAQDNNSTATVPQKKKKMLRRVLTITPNPSTLTPRAYTKEELVASHTRLLVLQKADEVRKTRAAALNDLEAYIYKVKNRIMDEEEELKKVSTDEQRQEVMDVANNAEDWLYSEGRDQDVPVYKAKQLEITTKAEVIFKRHKEIKARQEAVAKARSSLSEVRKQVETWAEKMPQITDAEKEDLLKAVEKAEQWISDKLEAQAAASPFETPVFDSSEVAPQLKSVSSLLEKLLKKPKPAPVVPEKNTTASDNSTSTAPTPEDGEVKVEREAKVESAEDEVANKENAEEKKTAGEEL